MGSLSRGLLCAVFGIVALDLPLTNIAQAQESLGVQSDFAQIAEPAATQVAPQIEYAALSELPDSPGSVRAQQQDSANQQSGSAAPMQQAASPQSTTPTSQPGDTPANQKLQRPAGTAAAEAPRVSGITAAEPAGIAIAPAKQHRVRTIVIKVGAILGAGAAVGTVIALTQATPSKPPGAH